MRLLFAAALLTCLPTAVVAQEKPAFAGPYAGPEVGLVIHGFTLSDGNGDNERATVTAGLAGGGFAGVMLPATPRLRLGGEVALIAGGGTARDQRIFVSAEQKARWGYSITARAGYVLGSRAMIFAEAGYGGYHFDHDLSPNIIAEEDMNNRHGLVAGGGIEYQLGRNVGLRLRAQGSASHGRVLIGVPIRF